MKPLVLNVSEIKVNDVPSNFYHMKEYFVQPKE